MRHVGRPHGGVLVQCSQLGGVCHELSGLIHVGPALTRSHLCAQVTILRELGVRCSCIFNLVGIVNLVANAEVEVCREIKAVGTGIDAEATNEVGIDITDSRDIVGINHTIRCTFRTTDVLQLHRTWADGTDNA